MEDRVRAAALLLKKAKSEGLTYYGATRLLDKQGFSPDEIARAAYQFPYTTTANEPQQPAANIDQAFAKGVVHQEAVDTAKKEVRKSFLLSLFGPSLIGKYFGTKVVSDYAALQDLREQDALGESKNHTSEQPRVVQRDRAVRYFGVLLLIALAAGAPTLISNAGLLAQVLPVILHHDHPFPVELVVPLGSMAVFVASAGFVALLFLARKETTIRRGAYSLLGVELLFFVVLGVLARSPILFVAGMLIVLLSYWISGKVGLLSQVG